MREFAFLASLAACAVIFYGGFFWWLWISIKSASPHYLSVMGMGLPAWTALTLAGSASVLLLMYWLFCWIIGKRG